MDSSTAVTVDQLPPEIFDHVFDYLQIKDRKAVRLVCKTWNALCTRTAIVRNEKFVFPSSLVSSTDLDKLLQNCDRVRPTIEFHGYNYTRRRHPISGSTWRRIGEQILSLSMVNCVMSTETTMNIFLHCSNMHTYKSVSTWEMPDPLCSPEMLDKLIQLNIVCPKVTSFELYVDKSKIPIANFLQKLFKIFPCISTFGTGYPLRCSRNHGMDISSLRDAFNPALIKELTFNLPTSHRWLQELVNIPQMRLQKLELAIGMMRDKIVCWDKIRKFLQEQSELETLKISILGNDLDDYAKLFLFESLSICPKLVNLCLCSSLDLKMSELFQILRMVSTSKLKCFILSPKHLINDAGQVSEHDLNFLAPLANVTLQTLHLYFPELNACIPEYYCSPILMHFSNLRHLEISVDEDEVLQTIFQYHIHLYTLILHSISNCTSFGFTGRKVDSSDTEEIAYSITRLSELTHLELDGYLPDKWVDGVLRELNFPHLKFLRVELQELREVEPVSIAFLAGAIPAVKILMLDGFRVHDKQLLDLCAHLHELKILFYSWSQNLLGQLFMAQPSLTYIGDMTTDVPYGAHLHDFYSAEVTRDILFKSRHLSAEIVARYYFRRFIL